MRLRLRKKFNYEKNSTGFYYIVNWSNCFTE